MSDTPEVLDDDAVTAALDGLPGWRSEQGSLISAYSTPSAAAALALIAAIGDAAEEADHHPDVDWRYDTVFVRTTTHQVGGNITHRDVQLAIRIADLAEAVGGSADPGKARVGA